MRLRDKLITSLWLVTYSLTAAYWEIEPPNCGDGPPKLGTDQYSSGPRLWSAQSMIFHDVNVYSRTPFVQLMRGSRTLLTGYNRDVAEVYFHVSEYWQGRHTWTMQATMTPSDAIPATYGVPAPNGDPNVIDDGDKYGWWAAGAQDHNTGMTYMVSAPYDTIHGDDFTGSIYIYRGEFSVWTETQRLEPPAAADNEFLHQFGTFVHIDQRHVHTAVVGAIGDSNGIPGLIRAGCAYIYKATPEGTYWSLHQKLVGDTNLLYDDFGVRGVVWDEYMFIGAMGDSETGPLAGAVYVFRESRKPGDNMQWSQQQKLFPHDVWDYSHIDYWYGEFGAIHDHIYVCGQNKDGKYGLHSGSLYAYATTANVHFQWWTEMQKLYAPDPHAHMFFGTYTSVYGNLVVTGAFGEAYNFSDWATPDPTTYYRAGAAYLFVKDRFIHKWSLQQKFLWIRPKFSQYFSDPYLYGSSLIIRDTNRGYMYDDTLDWNCIMVSLGDQYGDGYSTASATFTDPNGFMDTWRSYCDSHKPFIFRYCPLAPEEIGLYTFKIDVQDDSRYTNDIYWTLTNEVDGETYTGGINSSATFRWYEDQLSFLFQPTPHDKLFSIGDTGTCPKQLCEPYHPPGSNYIPFTMTTTSGAGWWTTDGSGPSYTIYKNSGLHANYTRTLCPDEGASKTCYHYLPDGYYSMRMGGLSSSNPSDHSYTFCGITGGVAEHINFDILNGECTARDAAGIPPNLYCLFILKISVFLSGEMLVKGIPQNLLAAESSDVLNRNIGSTLALAVKNQLSQYVQCIDVEAEILSSSPAEDGYSFAFNLKINLEGGRGNLNAPTALYDHLMSSVASGAFSSTLSSAAVTNALDGNELAGVESVTFKYLHMNPTEYLFDEEAVKDVAGIENGVLRDKRIDMLKQAKQTIFNSDNMLDFLSVSGYTFFGCAALVIVYSAFRLATSKQKRNKEPSYVAL